MKRPRRAALQALVLGAAAVCGREVHRHFDRRPPHPDYRTLARRLARLAQQHRAMRHLGFDYLKSLQARPTADLITQRWFPSAAERLWAMALTPEALAQHVAARTREDFRLGHIVTLKGWMLSETEAEFAGLAALVRRL